MAYKTQIRTKDGDINIENAPTKDILYSLTARPLCVFDLQTTNGLDKRMAETQDVVQRAIDALDERRRQIDRTTRRWRLKSDAEFRAKHRSA